MDHPFIASTNTAAKSASTRKDDMAVSNQSTGSVAPAGLSISNLTSHTWKADIVEEKGIIQLPISHCTPLIRHDIKAVTVLTRPDEAIVLIEISVF